MMVFLLKHNHYLTADTQDSKILGVFSSLIACNKAISEYKTKLGFCEQPNNFKIEEHLVTSVTDFKKISDVFLVQHSYEDNETGNEHVTFIGIFASSKEAKSRISRMKTVSPYNRAPLGFFVDCYPLDKMFWVDGYDTWTTG